MKSFIIHLREFIRQDFHLSSYLYTFFFLLISFILNYTFEIEDKVIDGLPQEYRSLGYFLFYITAWYGVAVPIVWMRKEKSVLHSKVFWMLPISLLAILSLDVGFYYHRIWLKGIENFYEEVFARKIFVNLFSMCFYALLFYGLNKWWWKNQNTYGLGLFKPTGQWKAYAMLWLLMLPLLVWASFQEDFIDYYPEFKPWRYQLLFGLDPWWLSPAYELCYAFDFLAVEWMFRGALGIGLALVLGRHAILPMVSCYAYLHFGKPMAEAIGSIFGGYILGVLAIRTGSIWGGCLVHIGIALSMDALAIFQFWRRES